MQISFLLFICFVDKSGSNITRFPKSSINREISFDIISIIHPVLILDKNSIGLEASMCGLEYGINSLRADASEWESWNNNVYRIGFEYLI
jgi:hypothetical protein